MCWKTLIFENSKPRIASEDIPVYKVLNKDHTTPYMRYRIKFDERLPKVDVTVIDSEGISKIEEGYHSYVYDLASYNDDYGGNKLTLNTDIGLFYTRESYVTDVYIAYVPKGTKYYVNERGEVVSESLVITEKTIKPQRYKNPLIEVVVMTDGNLKVTKVPYDEIEKTENIIGIAIDINHFSSTVWFESMRKEDWIPRTIDEYVKSIDSLMPKGCKICTKFDYPFFISHAMNLYHFAEILHGKVDWTQPVYNFHRQQFESFYSSDYDIEYDKGYIIPIYSCKIPIPIE